ncbi:hypothetical protein [Kitasatospora sp. GP82]|uniref:hypothetical protein n=1 Tax=Kitasatospora sp. GP82 TaxID=3035089 RepID=UPI002475D804|nr:hypothetical protein [Kitasatospora sp. GP82]MDH6123443.1 hypothetical protein [Kitasatospora sp. GP82]
MPSFTYSGPDDGRYYPTLGLAPVPGRAYDLGADPGDGAWTPAPPTATAATTAPAAPAAPGKEAPANA